MNIYQFTIEELLKKKAKSSKDLSAVKREAAKKFKDSLPSNVRLLKEYHKLLEKKRIGKSEQLERLLRKRPVRTLSGVAVVSVLTKPYPCPGECVFCPQEKGLPKSYLRGEPAAERALKLKFDPFWQVQKRIESLEIQGHPTDKIEVRIIGATFSSYSKSYKIWFLTNIFAAANKGKITKEASLKKLQKEQKINEKAKNRIVGVSIETRPDLVNKEEIKLMRRMGVTMVELGVQTVNDKVLKKCKRGHGKEETILATKLLKDTGFKVMYQIMPNLPGSDPKKDLLAVKEIFESEKYKPDWLKIYPCLVCKGAKLYNLWKKGNYRPYSDKELKELLIKIKQGLPYWARVARLFRDIPASKIEAGSKVSNLREVVQEEMKGRKTKCKCIRCREVKERYNPREKLFLFREDYLASEGKEIFLSFENKTRTKLFAFLRLRFTSATFLPVLKDVTIVRALHTYGQMMAIDERSLAPQHKGLGKSLMKKAEEITRKEFKLKRLAVISGVGARDYYRKIGYRLKGDYMVKNLS